MALLRFNLIILVCGFLHTVNAGFMEDPSAGPSADGVLVLMGKTNSFFHNYEIPNWLLQPLIYILSYLSIFIPGYFLRKSYLASGGPVQEGRSCWLSFQRSCFSGASETMTDSLGHKARSAQNPRGHFLYIFPPLSTWPKWFLLCALCFGLQVAFLTWGVMQEQILTRRYGQERFGDAQFLTFANRMAAAILSGIWLIVTRRSQPLHRAPYYQYSYASFTNTLSSWCQLEALKYVSFPTQILAKASKTIPVMIMGVFVRGVSYSINEYLSAGVMTLGMSLFLWSRSRSGESKSRSEDSHSILSGPVIGAIILVGYMVADSFTSNWQKLLFKAYRMSKAQIMFGVSSFSFLLTMIGLIGQGSFFNGFSFAGRHPEFLIDVGLYSIAAALGQVVIYTTLDHFNPVVLTILMTVRQVIAVPLSAFLFGHDISPLGIVGVCLVFLGVAGQIWSERQNPKEADRK